MDNIITDRYFEDWTMVRNSLQSYCENSRVEWTEEWDEVLNIAGFDQGNCSNYNYDPNSDSRSSSRRRRSLGSENIWLSASSTFGSPMFFAGFVIYKSEVIVTIVGIVADSMAKWTKLVEGKVKGFGANLRETENINNKHLLIFGPWKNIKELPKNIADMFVNLDAQGANGNQLDILMEFDGFTRELLNNIAVFETSLCKLQWTINQEIPRSFGVMAELLLGHASKCLRKLRSWEEKISRAQIYSHQNGEKRKRESTVIASDDANTPPKKRRFELLLDQAGTSEIQMNSKGINFNMEMGGRIIEQSEPTGEDNDTLEQEIMTPAKELHMPRDNPDTHASFRYFIIKKCSVVFLT
ncbi:hypothetical protein LIER_38048 [Lithospermum erythrorhizon]|uniref:Uncharacterized protein n=1 Tax=Lithospermum erythrorhizon TaxID=34254 RepID=A0AAV3PVX7_LITER